MMFLHNVEAYQYFLIPFTSSASCRTLLNLFVVGLPFPPFELNASYETHIVVIVKRQKSGTGYRIQDTTDNYSQLVAILQTSRQQIVFAWLVQVVNKFGTISSLY